MILGTEIHVLSIPYIFTCAAGWEGGGGGRGRGGLMPIEQMCALNQLR